MNYMSEINDLLNSILPEINKRKSDLDEFELYKLKSLFISKAKEYININLGLYISDDELLTKDSVITPNDIHKCDLDEMLISVFSININKINAFIYAKYGISII